MYAEKRSKNVHVPESKLVDSAGPATGHQQDVLGAQHKDVGYGAGANPKRDSLLRGQDGTDNLGVLGVCGMCGSRIMPHRRNTEGYRLCRCICPAVGHCA